MTLEQFLEQKRNMLLEIKTITCLMDEALEMEDTDKFLRLINDRQTFIDKINDVDEQVALIEHNTTTSQDNECNDTLREEISTLVKDIQVTNNKLQIRAEEFYGGIKKKLKDLKNAKRATQSYSSRNSQVYGYFIEKKK
ncbi:hypothetical protein DCCM_2280 [Desulfocucumis palustris]|uniref:Flagellar protein FliT n=1 Tax=Desulfocucumis palustris TaxID=1898651 RepID=A0A2L2XH25_9FIRM|nr:flagellar protein FliT [Desulfocucumis palustris]GBF33181.1 hypothetical protein DCCM_2280 [Desulfocucumis palustris]